MKQLAKTVAHNRALDLAGRRFPNGRSWLAIVDWACARELASVDAMLSGDLAPACTAAREAAYLVVQRAAAPDVIARALGITDHRAYAERDRAGGG